MSASDRQRRKKGGGLDETVYDSQSCPLRQRSLNPVPGKTLNCPFTSIESEMTWLLPRKCLRLASTCLPSQGPLHEKDI